MTAPRDEVECVPFVDQTRITAQDVVTLWTTSAGLSITEAQRRLSELLVVAIGPNNELIGVSTAYVAYNEQLRLNLWHVRAFIAQQTRLGDLGRRILGVARDILCERYVSGTDAQGLGILMVMQNQSLARHHDLGRCAPDYYEFEYAGEDEYGNSLRVVYFPDAKLPPQAMTPND